MVENVIVVLEKALICRSRSPAGSSCRAECGGLTDHKYPLCGSAAASASSLRGDF